MKISINIHIYELLLSIVYMFIYSCIWIALEYAIDGEIVNREVDNTMMIMLYPMFLFAAKYVLRNRKEDKNNETN